MAEQHGPKLVSPPQAGLWRVGRSDDPLRPSVIDTGDVGHQAGNRFDVADLGVCYFATRLEGCFAETLARFRPTAAMLSLLSDDPEWTGDRFMAPGNVPADWRYRRVAVRVVSHRPYAFVDVEDPQTHEFLTRELASQLAAIGVERLDVPTVRGKDRRVTRLLAQWASQPDPEIPERYAGIRYISRLGDWECWAVFEGVPLTEVERQPIFTSTSQLVNIANLFGLTVH